MAVHSQPRDNTARSTALLPKALRATIPVLRSMTEVEANNFGVFLFELLKQLVAWHRDEKVRGLAERGEGMGIG